MNEKKKNRIMNFMIYSANLLSMLKKKHICKNFYNKILLSVRRLNKFMVHLLISSWNGL